MGTDFRDLQTTYRAGRRPPPLRRSWLFLAGGLRGPLLEAVGSGADVLVQELETTVPPSGREAARALTAEVIPVWRKAGILTGVRVNPLESGGYEDLQAVMQSAPDIVMMSMVRTPDEVRQLASEVARLERENDIPMGSTELVPNVEDALGLINTYAIATASPRVTGCLVASEDMTASLGAVRSREGTELAYARSRFLVECTAAGVLAIDCPYTFSDAEGLEAECRQAYHLGFRAKCSAAASQQVPTINRLLTPSVEEVATATRIVEAFEVDPSQQPVLDGRMLELPIYLNARRLLERARALEVAGPK